VDARCFAADPDDIALSKFLHFLLLSIVCLVSQMRGKWKKKRMRRLKRKRRRMRARSK